MSDLLSVGNDIHDNLDWLDGRLVRLADEALIRIDESDYSGACNHCGSALEMLCYQIIQFCGGQQPSKTPPTLGDYYTVQKGPDKNEAPLQCALRKAGVSDEQIEAAESRLRQAANIRNKASHVQKSDILKPTRGDALLILEILGLLVRWHAKHVVGSCEKLFPEASLNLFLSVGTPHRLDQKQFIEKLRFELRKSGISLLNLSTREYSDDKPFDQIRQIMSGCDGTLVVGWERFHAYTMIERERSPKHNLLQDIHLATAWNQIEGSMSAALGVPLLVLKEARLHPDGIFEAANHGSRIVTFDLAQESLSLSSELLKTVIGWTTTLRKRKELT
jgi:hypothetical protein